MNVTLTINGLTTQAFFPDSDIEQLHLPLLRRFSRQQRLLNQPLIVFLVAPPGTGKSTLSAFWQKLSNETPDLVPLQTLPMDGFHQRNAWLDAHNLRHRKGAPETFDVAKLRHALMALREPGSRWPEYSRLLHEPVDGAIRVTAPLLIVEGNWLLLEDDGWRQLAEYCDVSVFIHASPDILRDRLTERKIRGGLTPAQAGEFYDVTDGPNVTRVLAHSLRADINLHMRDEGSYHSE
ncbi:nucleoside/nucleotide kinase family protein [Rahnella aquatilis]|uniref:nucleoside/nucleotide kinase family protein n=1 Tax=Rahnella aquatilis TaxID=34038 RepID=UPI00064759B5|nr:nucleoside/nucleotide kinase family protein [Rahnella aquatilis]